MNHIKRNLFFSFLTFFSASLQAAPKLLEFTLSSDASKSIAQILLYFPELGAIQKAASAEEIYSLESAQCRALLEQPERMGGAKIAEQSVLRCLLKFDDASTKELLLVLRGEEVEYWGNTYNNGVESNGAKSSELIKILKHLHFMSPKEMDLSSICDPNFNYCIESYGISSDLGSDQSFQPLACSITSELAPEAISYLKSIKENRKLQYEYLQKPDEKGWIERQMKTGVRRVLKSSCRWSS